MEHKLEEAAYTLFEPENKMNYSKSTSSPKSLITTPKKTNQPIMRNTKLLKGKQIFVERNDRTTVKPVRKKTRNGIN